MDILLVGCLGAGLFVGHIAARNSAVHAYRIRLIQQISNHAQEDILHGRDWTWRYEAFDRVGYYRMLLEFWRPLRSFYGDAAFLREGGER